MYIKITFGFCKNLLGEAEIGGKHYYLLHIKLHTHFRKTSK